MTLIRVMQNLKKNLLVVWKITSEIWKIFTGAVESLKIGTLIGFFCPKLKIYELKISRVVICYDSEKRCKIERRIDMRTLMNFDLITGESQTFTL